MRTAVLLFDGVTALDAIGPYEVLRSLPASEVTFVAKSPGEVRTEGASPLGLIADQSLGDVGQSDIVLVPGGTGNRRLLNDEEILSWLRAVDAETTWTTSVCTGSLMLGAAGLLNGKRATCHWLSLERLRDYGAEPVRERFVEEGKTITAAGVSAGIDMALHLAGRVAGPEVAQAVQLGLEYDPQPPFNAGSPATAPSAAVKAVTAAARKTETG